MIDVYIESLHRTETLDLTIDYLEDRVNEKIAENEKGYDEDQYGCNSYEEAIVIWCQAWYESVHDDEAGDEMNALIEIVINEKASGESYNFF